VKGLTIVSALHTANGDRENAVTVVAADERGATYSWHFREPDGAASRGAPTEGVFRRFVRAADLAGAPRLDAVFEGASGGPGSSSGRPAESPGFTAFSISSAIYGRLRKGETTRFTVTEVDGSHGIGGGLGRLGAMFVTKVTVRGTLAPTSTRLESIPILLDSRRVTLPALHVQGRFQYQDEPYSLQLWVLADSTHPLILKSLANGETLQTIRIDRPDGTRAVEKELSSTCRAELPGVYFGFASAELEPASGPALAEVARLLAAHGDWKLAIEGHTDSIGGATANQKLSEQRAAAVREALVDRYHIRASRLDAVGYGSSRPRESNATLEGRARNRRVELVRPCAKP
jgi:outer membrane protein OmpA-like peptidoglycan-associated protein